LSEITYERGANDISFLGITGYAIIEGRWSVRWSGYDRTGDKVVALDLEAGLSESLLQLENRMMLSRKALWTRRWKAH
jgi:hypothetical protein